MIRFRSLRTRLTVVFVTLFAVALAVVGVAVTMAVGNGARTLVRNELAATGQVYEAIWKSRTDQLRQGAGVLARDFGFREAVATADEATVRSALDNLRARQGVDGALMMATDGYVTSTGITLDDAAADALWTGLNSETEAGVLTAGGRPFQAVAAPILAPTLIGWVVFVDRLDEAEMTGLQELSAIPLTAAVLSRDGEVWRDGIGVAAARPTAAAVSESLEDRDSEPVIHASPDGEMMTLARALPSFDAGRPAALMLTYPLKLALQPYGGLFLVLALIGVAAAALLAGGAWALSRSVTRPISDLDRAVHALERGEHAEVPVTTDDEIGRLAAGFNAMVEGLKDREARLTHLALHDQETGLANRRMLERETARTSRPLVVVVGVDRYEVVRNAIGHDAMGQLIQVLGMRLSALAGGSKIARIGADSLGLVMDGADVDALEPTVLQLLEAGAEPVSVNGAAVDVGLTIGVGDRGGTGAHIDSAIDRAAVAVDQARAARKTWQWFDEAAYGDPGDNLSLISELMTALAQGQVTLAYQPKHDYRAQKITGVEALMRWTHPRRGFVPPDLFIGMAEETGHIRALTEWAVCRALDDQRKLAEAGHDVGQPVGPAAVGRELCRRRDGGHARGVGAPLSRDHRNRRDARLRGGPAHDLALRRSRGVGVAGRLWFGPVVAGLSEADPGRRTEDRQGLRHGAGRVFPRRAAGQVDHRSGPWSGHEGDGRGRRDRVGPGPAPRHGLRHGPGLFHRPPGPAGRPDRQAGRRC
ncbi:MAG: EAL domain-containing protein [Alphaproteobacteria bacterium]|nr:EAL domain-containing protein [Alphaproteobacteria bacterium]MBU1526811.1 EAL domain-containing protein [Alphaproteobacteria bacterium]MBU2116822.1 EAL domain-containing protein [Alphaproteobacteria bacterium]MBU2351646.1 EAL domain-containing protein [Alphaproteobacteria bacterium]MBU2381315.1 EAL domain-containing protein [Alphaproteobacteria bacterium]